MYEPVKIVKGGNMNKFKKAQFNVEYFVVLTIFLTFSLYFAFRLTEFYPEYLKNVKEEVLRSEAYRLSEMLINDDGEPKDWTGLSTNQIKRIGLSYALFNKSNLLDTAKVDAFGDKCSSEYDRVKELVGSDHNFYVIVNDTTGALYTKCGSLGASDSIAVVRRVVAFENGDYGKLIVYMWW